VRVVADTTRHSDGATPCCDRERYVTGILRDGHRDAPYTHTHGKNLPAGTLVYHTSHTRNGDFIVSKYSKKWTLRVSNALGDLMIERGMKNPCAEIMAMVSAHYGGPPDTDTVTVFSYALPGNDGDKPDFTVAVVPDMGVIQAELISELLQQQDWLLSSPCAGMA